MFEHPEIFVIEKLSVEFMNKHMNVLGRAETLKRKSYYLDALREAAREGGNSLPRQICQKGIVFNSVNLPRTKPCHFNG
jgi:hypothetical protein